MSLSYYYGHIFNLSFIQSLYITNQPVYAWHIEHVLALNLFIV